jgi:hypothetical protein
MSGRLASLPEKRSVSRIAVIALLLGFLSLLQMLRFGEQLSDPLILLDFCMALQSIAFGSAAIHQIRHSGGRLKGAKLAIASIVLGFSVFVVAMLVMH